MKYHDEIVLHAEDFRHADWPELRETVRTTVEEYGRVVAARTDDKTFTYRLLYEIEADDGWDLYERVADLAASVNHLTRGIFHPDKEKVTQ